MQFQAQDKPIKEILFGHDYFRIPEYQRPYSWDISNCRHLWEDLFTFFESGKYTDGYFLGNIVINI